VYVGGRLGLSDLPPDTALIIDLTCEFSEPRAVRAHPGYRCHPVLDGAAPPEDGPLLAVLEEVARVRGATVIHCESGKGRAPSVAALALIARGVAPDLDAALAMVRAGRPSAAPTAVDHAFMQAVAARLVPAPGVAAAAPVPHAELGTAIPSLPPPA
jgi:protein-tyrosine phosphatase